MGESDLGPSPLTVAQMQLRALFDGLQSAPIVWQHDGSKEAWLDAQIRDVMTLAESNTIKDPLVAFDLYARALGLLILANQLGGG
jgi:hypothetical protein